MCLNLHIFNSTWYFHNVTTMMQMSTKATLTMAMTGICMYTYNVHLITQLRHFVNNLMTLKCISYHTLQMTSKLTITSHRYTVFSMPTLMTFI